MRSETRSRRTKEQRLICMAPKHSWCWLLVATLHILLNPTIIEALKVSVSIPELVKLNDAFWLNCSHHSKLASFGWQQGDQTTASDQQFASRGSDMQRNDKDEIYAIKWYKDDEEFYRYLPNAQPKVSIYETNGIQLDVSYVEAKLRCWKLMIYRDLSKWSTCRV